MSSRITPLEVIQTAGVMRTFPEFANKTFSELIDLAPQYLRQSKEAIERHQYKQSLEIMESQQVLSYEETAKLVTGKKTIREAGRAFEKLREALRAAPTDHSTVYAQGLIESETNPETWIREQANWLRDYYLKQQKDDHKKSQKTICNSFSCCSGRPFSDFGRPFSDFG